MRANYFLLYLLFAFAFSAIIIPIQTQTYINQTQENQTFVNYIYGVRWFLGDYFKFQLNQTERSQQMFILMFNSKDEIDDQVYLKIGKTRYGCYSRFMQILSAGEHHLYYNKYASDQNDTFTSYMYKCIITANIFQGQTLNYSIVLGWTDFVGKQDQAKIKAYGEEALYNGTLRIPQNTPGMKFIVAGDWGMIEQQIIQSKGYLPIRDGVVNRLKEDPSIAMLIFNGDIAYDFQGDSYIQMLIHIQPITSQIIWMVTPGNHDTVYHEDSFELFVQNFYTPMWYDYFNYFSLTELKSQNLVILSYNPQYLLYNQTDRLSQSLETIFKNQLSSKVTEYIKKNYDLIVYSHYPIYCSNPYDDIKSCDYDEKIFQTFTSYFQQMGMDLYLSGHLHLYERTKQICYNHTVNNNVNSTYIKGCPIYVVQGASGNNKYVQMEQTYPLKNISAKLVYNTGFGVLTTNNRNFSYSHYSMTSTNTTKVTDYFELNDPQINDQQNQNGTNNNPQVKREQNYILIIQILLGIVIVIAVAILVYRFKKGQKKQTKSDHVQMMEQNFQTPKVSHNNDSSDNQ